jgi:5-methyltetrahydropteroyltriglutamate--homocysteine methyltransferase
MKREASPARRSTRQLVLGYATERARDILDFGDKELGLGVVNPRTDRVETPAEILVTIERALKIVPAERLFLNPDCGFGTFSRRPVSSSAGARRKLEAMVEATREARASLAG